MSYQVHTAVFDGPLDLLLQLITARQVEITELSLSGLVSEYLAHLDGMREVDLEVTSEFLLIAATLIQLKARSLLPEDAAVDLDEELLLAEERDRLLSRLLACLTFRDVAAVIGHRITTNERFLGRVAGLDADIAPRPPELRITVGAGELGRIAARVFAAARAEPGLDHLDLDLPSVGDAIADLRERVRAVAEADFDALTAHCERPMEVAAYFLALLELARWGVVRATQEHRDAPITVVAGTVDATGTHSEWAS